MEITIGIHEHHLNKKDVENMIIDREFLLEALCFALNPDEWEKRNETDRSKDVMKEEAHKILIEFGYSKEYVNSLFKRSV